jgi:hypothetical protein
MPPQLLDDPKAENRLLRGMVQDMQADESRVQVLIFHRTFPRAGFVCPGGAISCVRQNTLAHAGYPQLTYRISQSKYDYAFRLYGNAFT